MTLSAGVLLSVLTAAGFGDMLSLLLRVTLIAAAGIALCYRLRKASAAKRYLAAMATLIALIALPVARAFLPTVPLPILPGALSSPPSRHAATPAFRVQGRSGAILPDQSQKRSTAPQGSTTPGGSGRPLSDYVIFTSLVVSSALLLHVLFSVTAAAITARRANRIDDAELRRELESACRRLGVTRAVSLRESPSVTVPSVWGFVRPVLLLPVEARRWNRERLRVVFLHEMAHVARHDGVGLLLARVATSVFWFHPLVWKLARVARRECERCCDDLVLAAGERATDYAAHLLAIVRSMSRRDRLANVAPALAEGSSFETRLVSILRAGQRRDSVSRPALVATIGVAGILLVATTVVQVVASPDNGDEVRERVQKANQDARQHARDVETAVQLAVGDEADASDPNQEAPCASASPCADPAVSAVASSMAETPEVPEVPEISEAPQVFALPTMAYSVAGSSYRHKSEDMNESGIEFMRDGQYSKAIAAFQEEIKKTGSSNAMYNLACAYALRGDKKLAFDSLQKSIENGFSNTEHMTEDEDLRSLQGDPHFYELVRLARDLQLFNNGRFGGMNDEEDWRKAVPRLERVTREHPDVGRAWANLGFARLEAGDPKGGAAAYQKALDLGWEKPTTLYNMACCAARAGDINGAFGFLDRADQAGFEIGEYAGTDSDLDALRGDPRYGAMLKRWDEKMAKEHRDKQSAETKQKTY